MGVIVVPKQLGFGEENTRKIPSKMAILLQGKRDAKKVSQKSVAQSPRYALPNDHFQARVQNAWGGLPRRGSAAAKLVRGSVAGQ